MKGKLATGSKNKFFSFILLMVLTTSGFSQIVKLPGGVGTPKNDREIMDKSKAKDPLNRMYLAHNKARGDKQSYESLRKDLTNRYYYYDDEAQKSFKSEKNILDSWIKNVEEGLRNVEEAKVMDPKFKWDKLEKDYIEELNTLKREHEEVHKNYLWRVNYNNRLTVLEEEFSSILYIAKNVGDAKETAVKVKEFNFINFRDTVNKAKEEDPEMEEIPGLKRVNQVLEKDLPKFLNEFSDACSRYINDVDVNSNEDVDVMKDKFSELDALFEALKPWFSQEKVFTDLVENSALLEKEILADAIEQNAKWERQAQEDLEQTYMPKARISDPAVTAFLNRCIKENLSPTQEFKKLILSDEWHYDRHTYTNQVTSRWARFSVILELSDGKCYIYEDQVVQIALEGGGYKAFNFEEDCGSLSFKRPKNYTEDPIGQEIKCERVK